MALHKSIFLVAALVAVLGFGCAPGIPQVGQVTGSASPPPAAASVTAPPATDTATAPPATFTSVTEPATGTSVKPASFPSLNILHMLDKTNGWAYDTDGKLYKTADGGASWNLVTLPEGTTAGPYASSFLDAKQAWLSYTDAAGAPGLLHTSDGGSTWTPLAATGLANDDGQAGFRFSNPNDGLATVAGVGAGNLYLREFETHDGGLSFQVVPLVGLTDEQGLPEGTVHLCNICADAFYYNPSFTIIVEGDMATMQPRGAVHLHLSTDLGQHWKETTLPLPAGYQDALVGGLPLTFPQGGHGFLPVRLVKYNADGSTVYDALAIYETPDGGVTWSLTPTVLAGVNPSTLIIVDDLDAIVLCGSNICATQDAAHTWQTITPNINLANTDTRYVLQMNFVDPSTGWIIISDNGRYLLYNTVDGGSTWTQLTP